MTSDITFRTEITSRKKKRKNNNYKFVTLAQLTKYSRNTTKQSTKSMHL